MDEVVEIDDTGPHLEEIYLKAKYGDDIDIRLAMMYEEAKRAIELRQVIYYDKVTMDI